MEQKNRNLGLVAGENLKRLIKENNYTQETFAEAFSCDDRTVRRWIGQGIDKLSLLEQIADFFDMDIMELLK